MSRDDGGSSGPPSSLHPNLVVSPSQKVLKILFTQMRNKDTSSEDFVRISKRAMRILAEDALGEFSTESVTIETPCGPCGGLQNVAMTNPPSICAVSIVRSGDALLESVREILPGIRVGKILIQRDETHPDKIPKLFYSKLPPNVKDACCGSGGGILLCDPMLATGGSAKMAIEVLVTKYGIDPKDIIFANMICAPEGLRAMASAYPATKIVTACIDEKLNDDKFIVPGLGDYGDRFFGTN